MKTSPAQKTLFRDILLLLFSNGFVKGLGFLYRVLLVRFLGTECVGLVEMAAPLFSFLLVLSGLGVQTALAQIIAAHPEQRFLYFRAARSLSLVSAALATALAYLAGPLWIRQAAPDPRVLFSFLFLIPAIPIISWASVFRGYLQGLRRMGALAASQNLEQLVRSLLGVFLAGRCLGWALERAAVLPSLATVAGESAGLLVLALSLGRERREMRKQGGPYPWQARWKAIRRLLGYGLPLTGGRLVSSATQLLQALLIPGCLLAAGWDTRAATTLYGQLSGVAMSLLHLPGVFTSALAVVILPAVAESAGQKNRSPQLQHRVAASLRATLVSTVPGMLALYLFAEPYCVLLFHTAPAGPLLRILSIGGLFLYLQISLVSILQGMGKVRWLFFSNLLCGGVLLAGVRLLTPLPRMGIRGAAVALVLSWVFGFLLHSGYLRRCCRLPLPLAELAWSPLLSAGAALLCYRLLRLGLEGLLPLDRPGGLAGQTLLVLAIYAGGLFLTQRKIRK